MKKNDYSVKPLWYEVTSRAFQGCGGKFESGLSQRTLSIINSKLEWTGRSGESNREGVERGRASSPRGN